MAGTVAVATKRKLIEMLRADPGLAGVEVFYSFPGRTVERDVIYGGQFSPGEVQLASMAGGGRLSRREDLTLDLHIESMEPGHQDTLAVDERVCAFGLVVEHLVAGNPTLDNSIEGLRLIKVMGVDLDGGVEDEAAIAVLTYKLGIMSHIR
jgi:hypothetical protein